MDLAGQPSVAILTPIGRGAVATIHVEGEMADLARISDGLFLAANRRGFAEQALRRIVYGRWGAVADSGEQIVVCRTTMHSLEIHCHGGNAAVQRIVDDLKQAGCRELRWQQQRTLCGDLLEAECRDALSQTTTWRTAEILHEQTAGLLRTAYERLLQGFSSEVSDSELLLQIDALLGWSQFGQHLWRPWQVVLTGRPNVGKSSLINSLLGYQRAIVFDQPGTTRDVVTAETAFEGWPVMLADTAGLRHATDELESAGITRARERLESADARLVLIDLSESPTEFDKQLIREWPDAILVAHKCDLDEQWGHQLPESAIRVSSVTRTGLEALQRCLIQQLIPAVPPPGTPVPINQRQSDLLIAARNAIGQFRRSLAQQAIAALLTVEFPGGESTVSNSSGMARCRQ